MSHTPNYISGSHLFTCDRCGSVYHADKKRKEWTGLMVCGGPGTNHCWEPRHPQEFIRARPEDPSVRDNRPLQDWTNSDSSTCTLLNKYGGVGVATAGCAVTTDTPPTWE